jgi:hypothetical protein
MSPVFSVRWRLGTWDEHGCGPEPCVVKEGTETAEGKRS